MRRSGSHAVKEADGWNDHCAEARRVNAPKMPRGRKVNACRNPVSTHHRMAWRQSLVWWFGSPHHFCSEPEMRTSEPKPHEINKLLVSFDPEVRNRGTGTMMRTSASGHACIDHRSAEPGMGRGALS